MSQPITITGRRILSDEHYKLEAVSFTQTKPDGSSETLHREVFHNPPGAAVLPIDRARGTCLLVRQLRLPAYLTDGSPTLIEACAGIVDDGEDPAETVRREAEEELGTRIHAITRRFALYTSPGSCTETLHLFTAGYTPADRTGDGGGLPGEGEQIQVLELELTQAWEMAENGTIRDAKTMLLLQQAKIAAA